MPEAWPCAYIDQNGQPCSTHWCIDHVEFVGQDRFCHRHAMLVGSSSGRCGAPGCGAHEVWTCSYHDRHGNICGSAHCRDHVVFVGAVPFCPEHAATVGTLAVGARSVREIKTLPTLDDKCAALAMFISEELDEEITDLLKRRFAARPDVTVMSDERVRDMWYKQKLVWWRTWGALTNTGYLTRVALWIPMVVPPTVPEVHVLVDSNVVLKTVPEWVQRSLAGEEPKDSDLPAFHKRVVDAIRNGLDMPATFLAEPASNGAGDDLPAAVSGPAARVLVVAADKTAADAIVALAGADSSIAVVGAVVDAESAVEQAQTLSPNVIVLEFGGDSETGAWICERVLAVAPEAEALVILEEESKPLLRVAHQAGAADVLVWPFSSAALVTAVGRLATPRQPALAVVPVEAPVPGPPAPVAAAAVPQPAVWLPPPPEPVAAVAAAVAPAWQPPPVEAEPAARAGEITVVFSGKGGVGKTLLATNLAAAVAARTGSEVGLVDLDLQFGDLAVLLGVKAQTSISNAVESYPDLDSEFLAALMPVAADGIRLLAAPIKPELSDLVKAEHVRAVLQGLRANHRHVFVDCGTHLDDRTLEAVETADKIVLVVDLDLSTIKNGRVALDIFNRLNVPSERVFVALNRADRERTVSADQVERLLRHPVTVRLPYERDAIREAVTAARAAVVLEPQALFSRQVEELARLIGYS
jgi:pilus assembly protein CpaE